MEYGRRISVLAFLLSITFAAAAYDEWENNPIPYKDLKADIPAECRGLHKVKDIDDLLLQMYENIDSLCLFEIDEEKLANV